jgi:hypothetical protein
VTERTRIEELCVEAQRLPECATKLSLLEEAVRLADLMADVELGYDLRRALVRTATFCGREDVQMVAFAWCLAQYDRNPGRFDERGLLWQYKWVVGNATDFPDISRRQIEELLDDIERRFQAAGHSLHAVHQHRRYNMVDMRDRPAAEKAHAAFLAARRDRLSDCAACVACNSGEYYIYCGDMQAASAGFQTVIDGRLTCQEEPLRCLSYGLLPLVRLGQIEQAKRQCQQAQRLLAKAGAPVRPAAAQIAFLAIVNDLAAIRRMLRRYLAEGLACVSPKDRLAMLRAVLLAVHRLTAAGSQHFESPLPDQAPPADSAGHRDVALVQAWLTSEARTLAARFDARNGNGEHIRELDRLGELLELVGT